MSCLRTINLGMTAGSVLTCLSAGQTHLGWTLSDRESLWPTAPWARAGHDRTRGVGPLLTIWRQAGQWRSMAQASRLAGVSSGQVGAAWLLHFAAAQRCPAPQAAAPASSTPRCELPTPRSFRVVVASQSVELASPGTVVVGPVAALWCCTLAMVAPRLGLMAPEVSLPSCYLG